MDRQTAIGLLGVSDAYQDEEVRKAYARLLKAIHPDKTLTLVADAAVQIARLQQAKEALLHKPLSRGIRPRLAPWEGGGVDVPFFVHMHQGRREAVTIQPVVTSPQRRCCFPGCLTAVPLDLPYEGDVCCGEHTHVRYAHVVAFKRPTHGHRQCLFCSEFCLFGDQVCGRHLHQAYNQPINHRPCNFPGCGMRAIHRKIEYCFRHSELPKGKKPY